MTSFPGYAISFELHPQVGEAFRHLSPLLGQLKRVEFVLRVDDPTANQGQMASDFDRKLEQTLQSLGAVPCLLPLPPELPQELDFAFSFAGRMVAVEIEKTNREKILRDILKCHMYLHAGADFSVVALPKNYPHKHGVWNLFEFGVQRFNECQTYGFGTPDKLSRILLLGFEQFDTSTGEVLSRKTRRRMREQAGKPKTAQNSSARSREWKPRTGTIGFLVREMLLSGQAYPAILEAVRREFSDSKFNRQHYAWYRSRLQQSRRTKPGGNPT